MRRLVVGVLLALSLVACGDDGPSTPLGQTAANLGKIRSADLEFSLTAIGKGTAPTKEVGFRLGGPFQLAEPGKLPVARLTYTQLAGANQGETTLLSTGDAAYAEVKGTAYRLPDERVAALRRAEGSAAPSGLGQLRLDTWMLDPKTETAGDVDTITARVDVAQALADLDALVRRVGAGGLGGLEMDEQGRQEIARAVTDATAVVTTGHDDRLLRRLLLTIRLGGSDTARLPAALRALVPVEIVLDLGLGRVNQPVTVTAPADARPYSDLPKG